jgi:hypothetical protein
MNIKRKDIDYDPQTDKLATCIAIKLIDGNGMMLKAKAELYASIMEGLDSLVNAKIAEFAERYGDEVIKFAHNNIADDLRDEPHPKIFVSSKELQRKLLDRAFKSK